jgi:2-hydroxychromene-2-carboxylate isomerase
MNTIEVWYEFGSNYSYLSVNRMGALALSKGVAIKWEPFLLGPVFKSLGWETSPFVLQEQKGRYVWKDMERQCAKYGLAWNRPSTFPRRALLPMRVAVLGKDQMWIEAFSKRMMELNFVEDVDIDSVEVVSQVLKDLGVDAASTIEKAQSDDNKQKLKAQTERALSLGVFGGPTFFVNGEMFWGNDRLDDALEYAARGSASQLVNS